MAPRTTIYCFALAKEERSCSPNTEPSPSHHPGGAQHPSIFPPFLHTNNVNQHAFPRPPTSLLLHRLCVSHIPRSELVLSAPIDRNILQNPPQEPRLLDTAASLQQSKAKPERFPSKAPQGTIQPPPKARCQVCFTRFPPLRHKRRSSEHSVLLNGLRDPTLGHGRDPPTEDQSIDHPAT